ncbi:MAG TPA: oligosaccharide flippase family protein, partial [Anaerovoracaceae bacterium]|nr:oligosaccharide flippase family protein [Anaerovoracaceae bacterium]
MTSDAQKNKTFVKGAVVLGIAGITIKVLGAAFRIPLTNIIGDSGMGYYQTAYPIYVLFLTIATAGIPTAISRMVAERNAVDQGCRHRRAD